jgi:hypothetical protein
MIRLGDMTVAADKPPRSKLMAALTVIGERLHTECDLQPGLEFLKSRRSCVLASLAVRDFLIYAGFRNARVRPVAAVIMAARDGKMVHSVGIGVPHDERKREGYWCGHMAVTVGDLLIDTTLYPCRRPAWPDLPGMMAVQLMPQPWQRGWWDLEVMAGVDLARSGTEVTMIGWFDNPANTRWQAGPDAREAGRRAGVVKALLARFDARASAA